MKSVCLQFPELILFLFISSVLLRNSYTHCWNEGILHIGNHICNYITISILELNSVQ